jgi:pimeloyl-ACP methyl ester carboxylesterase
VSERYEVANGHLAVLEAGVGGRPLLLVHGFTGAKEDFADWIDPLAAEGWWVVAPDLRGHGDSHQPEGEEHYGVATFADELLALVAQLGWDRFALLGHSMGGMVAQHLAVHHEHRLDRLVLMDTHHGPVEGLDEATVAIALDVLRTQGLPALVDLLAALPPAPRSPSEVRLRAERPGFAEWSDGKVLRCSGHMYAALAIELTTRADQLPALAQLALPTLVLVGEDDRAFVGAAHRMAAAMPSAELVVVPDAAHSPQLENPAAWWSAVSGFLGAPAAAVDGAASAG